MQAYYTDGVLFPDDGKLTKIAINGSAIGGIYFAIGFVDQFNIPIIEKEFSRMAVIGNNNIILNVDVKKGQTVFVKTPGKAVRYKSGVGGKQLLYSSGGYDSALTALPDSHLSMLVYFAKTEKLNVPTLEEYKKLESDFNALKNRKTLTYLTTGGFIREITSDDNGANLRTKSIYPDRTVVIGNSISASVPIVDKWWGTWGMAASQKSKDWVRVLESRIKSLNPTHSAIAYSANGFEQNHPTYNMNLWDSYFATNPDMVILQLGENANNNIPQISTNWQRMFDYVRSKAPQAKIVCTGMFWTNIDREVQIKAACDAKGVQYVKIDNFFDPTHTSFKGAIVKGDDGLDHVINDAGVSWHPNDLGMKRIADTIFNHVFA